MILFFKSRKIRRENLSEERGKNQWEKWCGLRFASSRRRKSLSSCSLVDMDTRFPRLSVRQSRPTGSRRRLRKPKLATLFGPLIRRRQDSWILLPCPARSLADRSPSIQLRSRPKYSFRQGSIHQDGPFFIF